MSNLSKACLSLLVCLWFAHISQKTPKWLSRSWSWKIFTMERTPKCLTLVACSLFKEGKLSSSGWDLRFPMGTYSHTETMQPNTSKSCKNMKELHRLCRMWTNLRRMQSSGSYSTLIRPHPSPLRSSQSGITGSSTCTRRSPKRRRRQLWPRCRPIRTRWARSSSSSRDFSLIQTFPNPTLCSTRMILSRKT